MSKSSSKSKIMNLEYALTIARQDRAMAEHRVKQALDNFAALNEHLVEAQQVLMKAGVEPGADGSIVVGIRRLVEKHDEMRFALKRICEERDYYRALVLTGSRSK